MKDVAEYGSDARLLRDASGAVSLVSATTKFLTILSAKMANFVPGGEYLAQYPAAGMERRKQRPRRIRSFHGNSLHIRRTLVFLLQLYREIRLYSFPFPGNRTVLPRPRRTLPYQRTGIPSGEIRRAFVDRAGLLFETQRNGCIAPATTRKALRCQRRGPFRI